jgi:ZIP family zinc transporter
MTVFWMGLLSASSLIVGGIIGAQWQLSRKYLGIIMGFGAGALISAVSYELVLEAAEVGRGTLFPIYGLFAGALTFFGSDYAIEKFSHNSDLDNAHRPSASPAAARLLVPMVLAIVLDGVPESIVLGLGMFENGQVSLSMMLAVFMSNLPEALAGTAGMKACAWSRRAIVGLWTGIAVVCALATLLGYHLFSQAPAHWLSFIQAFAGGAILMMLANSMMPESFEHGGKWAGVMTVLGFAVAATFAFVSHAG